MVGAGRPSTKAARAQSMIGRYGAFQLHDSPSRRGWSASPTMRRQGRRAILPPCPSTPSTTTAPSSNPARPRACRRWCGASLRPIPARSPSPARAPTSSAGRGRHHRSRPGERGHLAALLAGGERRARHRTSSSPTRTRITRPARARCRTRPARRCGAARRALRSRIIPPAASTPATTPTTRPMRNARRRRSRAPASRSTPSTRPATPRTTCASRSRRRARCFRAITSWRGRPPSSRRPTATWPPTWPRWSVSARERTRFIIPATARPRQGRGATCAACHAPAPARGRHPRAPRGRRRGHRHHRHAHLCGSRPAPRARRFALRARPFAGHDGARTCHVERGRGHDGGAVHNLPPLIAAPALPEHRPP